MEPQPVPIGPYADQLGRQVYHYLTRRNVYHGNHWRPISELANTLHLGANQYRVQVSNRWAMLRPAHGPSANAMLAPGAVRGRRIGIAFGPQVSAAAMPNALDWELTHHPAATISPAGEVTLDEIGGLALGLYWRRAWADYAPIWTPPAGPTPGRIRLDLRAAKARALERGIDEIDLDPSQIDVGPNFYSNFEQTADVTEAEYIRVRDLATDARAGWPGFGARCRQWPSNTKFEFNRSLAEFDLTAVGAVDYAKLAIHHAGGQVGADGQVFAADATAYASDLTEAANYGYIKQAYDNAGLAYMDWDEGGGNQHLLTGAALITAINAAIGGSLFIGLAYYTDKTYSYGSFGTSTFQTWNASLSFLEYTEAPTANPAAAMHHYRHRR